MTILNMIQNVTYELGLPSPSTVATSTDSQVRQLITIARRLGDIAATRYRWPQLIKRQEITLSASDNSYGLNADFERFVPGSMWDQTNQFPLIGPVSPQEFEFRTYGIGGTTPRVRFSVRGNSNEKLLLYPTPGSADTYSFLYISKNWILPTLWVTGEVFSADDYCSYNGNIYQTAAGGTAGAVPPTHTTGSESDGTVTWTYQPEGAVLFDSFAKDGYFSLIDELTLELGIISEFCYRNGLQYEKTLVDYEKQLRRQAHALNGGKTLNLAGGDGFHLLNYWNIPDSNYGS